MKKLMSILFTMTFLSFAMAQDVRVESISNIDLNTEYESYAFLTDADQQMSSTTSQQGESNRADLETERARDMDQQNIEPSDRGSQQQYGQNQEYNSQSDRTNLDRTAQSGTSNQRSTTSDQNVATSGQNITNGQNVARDWATMNPIENVLLKEAITYQFDVAGLEWEKQNPDVYIQYHIYEGEYTEDDGYYPAPSGAGVDAVRDDTYDEDYYQKKQAMMSRIEDGTVILSVVDAEEGTSVWEGFAFNAYKDGASVREKQIGLRQAADALVTQFLADNEDDTGAGTISR